MTQPIGIAEYRKWCEEKREEAFLTCTRTHNCDCFNALQRIRTLCDEVERLREEIQKAKDDQEWNYDSWVDDGDDEL